MGCKFFEMYLNPSWIEQRAIKPNADIVYSFNKSLKSIFHWEILQTRVWYSHACFRWVENFFAYTLIHPESSSVPWNPTPILFIILINLWNLFFTEKFHKHESGTDTHGSDEFLIFSDVPSFIVSWTGCVKTHQRQYCLQFLKMDKLYFSVSKSTSTSPVRTCMLQMGFKFFQMYLNPSWIKQRAVKPSADIVYNFKKFINSNFRWATPQTRVWYSHACFR